MRRIAIVGFLARAGGTGWAAPADEDAMAGSEEDQPRAPRVIAAAVLDAADVAGFVARELAGELAASGVLEPVVVEVESRTADPAAPAELGSIAEAVEAEFALGGSLRVTGEALELALVLADATGALRALWSESLLLGEGPWAAQRIARSVLLATGDEASAPPELLAAPVPPGAFLALCRAARLLEHRDDEDEDAASAEVPLAAGSPESAGSRRARSRASEASDACADLLAVLEAAPELTRARDLLLEGAQDAVGRASMPVFLSALEQLVELRPQDGAAQLALGEYRVLHLDPEGARELFLAARENAEDVEQEASALTRLAQLAEDSSRPDEAVQHLRAAARLVDDAAFHLRLGALLREREPAEALRSFLRAVVLAPEAASAHLALAEELRRQGDAGRAANEAALAAQLAAAEADDETLAAAEALIAALQDDVRS